MRLTCIAVRVAGLIATATKQLADANEGLTSANANMTNTTAKMNAALAAIVTKQKADNTAVLAALKTLNSDISKNNSAFVALENARNALTNLENECKQPKAPASCPSDLVKAQALVTTCTSALATASTTAAAAKAAAATAQASLKADTTAYAQEAALVQSVVKEMQATIDAAVATKKAAVANYAKVVAECSGPGRRR